MATSPPASPPLGPEDIRQRLQTLCGDALLAYTTDGTRDPFCTVEPARWPEVALTLRDDPELRFDFLQCVTGVDWPARSRIECVYHLYSYVHRHAFVVKVELPRDNPVVPSVSAIWRSAEWNEREQYDLLGIVFADHPDLRRVLLPDDWEGHPLRKDWQEPARYRDMPTTRPSPLDLLPLHDRLQAEKRRLPVIAEVAIADAAAHEPQK